MVHPKNNVLLHSTVFFFVMVNYLTEELDQQENSHNLQTMVS